MPSRHNSVKSSSTFCTNYFKLSAFLIERDSNERTDQGAHRTFSIGIRAGCSRNGGDRRKNLWRISRKFLASLQQSGTIVHRNNSGNKNVRQVGLCKITVWFGNRVAGQGPNSNLPIVGTHSPRPDARCQGAGHLTAQGEVVLQ